MMDSRRRPLIPADVLDELDGRTMVWLSAALLRYEGLNVSDTSLGMYRRNDRMPTQRVLSAIEQILSQKQNDARKKHWKQKRAAAAKERAVAVGSWYKQLRLR